MGSFDADYLFEILSTDIYSDIDISSLEWKS